MQNYKKSDGCKKQERGSKHRCVSTNASTVYHEALLSQKNSFYAKIRIIGETIKLITLLIHILLTERKD